MFVYRATQCASKLLWGAAAIAASLGVAHAEDSLKQFYVRHPEPSVVAELKRKLGESYVFPALDGLKGPAVQNLAKTTARAQIVRLRASYARFEQHLQDLGITQKPTHYPKIANVSVLPLSSEQATVLTRKGYWLEEVPQYGSALYESVSLIGADQVWQQFTDATGHPLTGRGVKVGVIDTGIDYTHEAFGRCSRPANGNLNTAGCERVAGGFDFVNNDADPFDDNAEWGHGTHVAATIGGSGSLLGVAPEVTLYGLKVLNASGNGASIVAALSWALDPSGDDDLPSGSTQDRLDIVNLSIQSLSSANSPDSVDALAFEEAIAAGILPVIAAGNFGGDGIPDTVRIPGAYRLPLTVGATYKADYQSLYGAGALRDHIAHFSSRGPVLWSVPTLFAGAVAKPDVVAPGDTICAAKASVVTSTEHDCLDGGHIGLGGTSMAAPHVAGLAALLRQKYPLSEGWGPLEIKQAIKNSALSLENSILGGTYPARDQGHGRIRSVEALSFAAPPPIARLELQRVSETSSYEFRGSAYGIGFSHYAIEVRNAAGWVLLGQSTTPIQEGRLLSLMTLETDDLFTTIRLRVVSSSGESIETLEIPRGFGRTPNVPLVIVSVDPASQQEIAEWESIPAADSYKVYQLLPDGTKLQVLSTLRNQFRPVRGAPTGQRSQYVVEACQTYLQTCSAPSDPVSILYRGDNDTPAAVSSLSASALLPSAVQLSWIPPIMGPLPTAYRIVRTVDFGELWECDTARQTAVVGTVSGTVASFFESTPSSSARPLRPGVSYRYSVISVNGEKESSCSDSVVVTMPESSVGPATPTGLHIEQVGSRLDAVWDPAPSGSVDSYELFASPNYFKCDAGPHEGISPSRYNVGLEARRTIQLPNAPARSIYVSVRGKRAGTVGLCSDPVLVSGRTPSETLPDIPMLHSATRGSTEGVTLSFSRGVHATDEIRIYRSTTRTNLCGIGLSSAPSPLAILSGDSTSYIDASVEPGIAYYYAAEASNEFGRSGCSSAKVGYGRATPPGASSVPSISLVPEGVQISWSAVTDVAGYNLYRSDLPIPCSGNRVSKIAAGTNAILDAMIPPDATTQYYSLETISLSGEVGVCGAATVYQARCAGDVNSDGQINGLDLSILLAQFGTFGPNLAADLNGDGVVNGFDLSIVVNRYGQVCTLA